MGVSSPELGAFIKNLRVNAGDPPNRTIARHLGYTTNTIYNVYRGENGNWPTIERIIRYLSTNPADLTKARRMWISTNTNRESRHSKWREQTPKWALDLASCLDEILLVLTRIERLLDPENHHRGTP